MHTYAVIDFETTGLSPRFDRIIEVGVVLVRNHTVVDTFSELMDPGFRIPSYITELTGISTAMVKGKPAPEQVMPKLREIIGDCPCVVHNASFDRGFFESEMNRAGVFCEPPFLCSMLLARRLVQDSSSHKLGTLVEHLSLAKPSGMRAHRALADCLMTVELWKYLIQCIHLRLPGYQLDVNFIGQLSRTPKANVETFLYRSASRLNHTTAR
jgi:DNA polymerase III subunit epsilon